MRIVTPIAAGDGFSLERVTVRAEDAAWSEPELPRGHRLMLVRRGVFRARVGGRTLLADPALAYVGGPAEEQSIAHRAGVEDTCTAIVMSESFMAGLTRGAQKRLWAPVTGELAVAHRVLAVRARRCDDSFELAERTVQVVGTLLTSPSTGRADAAAAAHRGRTGTAAARRTLVESARELLSYDPSTLGLLDIARRLGCSPHHLSRVFRRETGTTLTGHRNRIRVLTALHAIEAGHADLAGLAAELGFADHAHLTRTVRRECGRTPRALRILLAAAN